MPFKGLAHFKTVHSHLEKEVASKKRRSDGLSQLAAFVPKPVLKDKWEASVAGISTRTGLEK